MNELEKIQSLQSEIKERQEKIKQSMLLLVQMLGDEVDWFCLRGGVLCY